MFHRLISVRNRPLRILIIAACVGGSIFTIAGTIGQQAPDAPFTLSGPSVADGVFIQNSTQAIDQFALAERLASLGDWDKAADVLQSVAQSEGPNLVAARSLADGRIYQYRPVGDAVRAVLASWPQAGRDAYRMRYAPEARNALEQARARSASRQDSLAALQAISSDYFLTSAGVEAAVEIVDRLLAEGNFNAAMGLADRFLQTHPDLESVEIEVGGVRSDAQVTLLLRSLAAARLIGNAQAAEAAASKLSNVADTPVYVGGEQATAKQAVALLQATDAVAKLLAKAGAWPTFGGGLDRSTIAVATPGEITPLFTVRMPDPTPPGDEVRINIRSGYGRARAVGQMTGIFPAVYDGIAYWTDNIRIYAVGLESRTPPGGWVGTYPGTSGDEGLPPGIFALERGGWATPRGVALTPLATASRIYAVMGLRDERFSESGGYGNVGESRVVSLDRETGRALWTRSPRELTAVALAQTLDDPQTLPDDEGIDALMTTMFVGSPVNAGGLIWISARTDPARMRQFEQSFVIGLDPDTGEARRVVFLATTATNQRRYNAASQLADPDPIIAAEGGVLFVPNGRGVLAAVSATDGSVLWLNLYARRSLVEENTFRGGRVQSTARTDTPAQPFRVSAPLLADGKVFYHPPDADTILIFDARDGERIGELPINGLNVGGPTAAEIAADTSLYIDEDSALTLFAVRGDRLFAFGTNTVYCLNWPAILKDAAVDDHSDDARMDWLHWSSLFPAQSDTAFKETLVGRPAVTPTHVLVPAREALEIIEIESGSRKLKLGAGARWTNLPPSRSYGLPPDSENPAGEAGNVIVLDDRVVVAGPTTLSVFNDEAAVRRQLEARLRENPNDPQPVLTLAELEFVGGDWEATEARLKQAAELTDGVTPAFETALALADSPVRPNTPGADTAGVSLLRLARTLAASPLQQVRIRFAMADTAALDPSERLASLQQVLADEALRSVLTTPGRADDLDQAVAAHVVASQRIDALLAEFGPELYSAIENEAQASLNEAGDKPEKLRKIVASYPNSKASRTALEKLADVYVEQEAFADARRTLRDLRRRELVANESTASATLERLAMLDLKRGDLAMAAARMRRLAVERPDYQIKTMTLADGRRIVDLPAAEVAAELNRLALERSAPLPNLNIPGLEQPTLFDLSSAVAIDDVQAILVQPRGHRSNDSVLAVMRDGTLSNFPFGSMRPAWSVDVTDITPAASMVLPDGEIIIWGEGGAARLDSGGNILWKTTAGDLASPMPAVANAVAILPVAGEHAVTFNAPLQNGQEARLEQELAKIDLDLENDEDRQSAKVAIAALRASAAAGTLQIFKSRNQPYVRFETGDDEAIGGDGRVRLHMLGNRAVLEDVSQQFVRPLSLRVPGSAETGENFVSVPADAHVRVAAPARDALIVVLANPARDGRDVLVQLSLDDGTADWTAALPTGRVVSLASAGDMVVVGLRGAQDEGSDAMTLVAFDLDLGRPVASRRLGVGAVNSLLNHTLLPTNELVTITATQVSVIDLEDREQMRSGARATATVGDGSIAFIVAQVDADLEILEPAARWLGDPTGGRLAVSGSTLLVMADPRQTGRHDAMVIDLATVTPRRVMDAATGISTEMLLPGGAVDESDVDTRLLPRKYRERFDQADVIERRGRLSRITENGMTGIRIWVDGPRVYIGGRRGLRAYDLRAPDGDIGPIWSRANDTLTARLDPAINLDLLLTQDTVLLLDAPGSAEDARTSPRMRVTPFSRTMYENRESGLSGASLTLQAGVSQVRATPELIRAMNGGLAILDESQRLIFLPSQSE